MVKVRISKAAKKQTESEVKLENQEENQGEGLLDRFGHDDNVYCEEKEFDDYKIVKEFLMKRKLLMKALKQKQKEKNPKLLTLQTFQNNEGSPASQQSTPQSNPYQDKYDITSKQTSSLSSFTQEIQQNKIEVQELYDQSDSKLNVGVQTKIITKRKHTKQSHSIKNGQEKYTVDYLIKDYENKQKNKENGMRIRKKRNPKDIESIKNQINTLFNKDSQQQFSSNSKTIHQLSDSLSDSQHQRSYYHDVFNIMKRLNDQIQNYYNSKPLKKIILTQLKSKIHRRIKEKQKEKRASTNLKSKRIKKHNKHQSFFLQSEDFQKKTQNKRYIRKKDQKNQSKKRKKSSARIINERFQILLTAKNESKFEKNPSIKMPQNTNLIDDDSDQNNICEIFEDSEATETPFDTMGAWNTEFGNIQLMLLQKYDFLGAYMTLDKKVDYKRILKNIRAENKENSDAQSRKNKTDTSSIKQSSDLLELIDVRNLPKHNNIGNSQKKSFKPIQRRPLKELQLEGQSQDEFGKSFDLHHQQYNSQTKPQQNVFIEDLNTSNVISHALNLSFYSQSTVKKSDRNSEVGNNNINHSFLSHAESSSTDSNHSEHSHKKSFPKTRMIENEGILFKGQKGKQSFYMSEEIK